MSAPTVRREVFLSYAPEDEPLCLELEKHLSLLKREGLIATWHKGQIGVGKDHDKEIGKHLSTASIIVLLLSAGFVASDVCYSVEMLRAMQRHNAGEVSVIPVVLRPMDSWQNTPFGSLQALPRNGVPVTNWSDAHAAFADVAQGIRSVVQGGKLSKSFKRPISRRVVMLGGVGLVVVGSGITWLALSHSSPSSATSPLLGATLYTYHGHTTNIRALAWSPNGKRIASGSADYSAQAWDALTGKNAIVYHGHSSYVEGVAWSPDSERIVSGSADTTVQIWEAASGSLIYIYRGHSLWVNHVSWSPDGKYIASGEQSSTVGRTVQVRVWEAATGKTMRVYSGHTNGVFAVAWSPNGTYIASDGYDGTVQVWEAFTGQRISIYRDNAFHYGLAWSPDSKRIVFGSGMAQVGVLDANTGNIIYTYDTHSTGSADTAWSANGTRIAVGTDRETIDVLDAMTGNVMYAYSGQVGNGPIFAVTWSPDSTCIASGSENGTIQVWQAR